MTAGLIAFILYLYFFVGFSSLFSVLSSLNTANYILYYSFAILATVLSILFVAAAWHDLLKSLSVKVKLRSVFLYTWAGYFVDLVVPCQAVCGEVTRIYLVHQENRENYGPIAASSLTNRIISYFMSSVGLLSGIVLVLTRLDAVPPLVLELLMIGLVGTCIYLGVLFYLAIKEEAAGKLAGLLFKVVGALKLSKYLSSDLPERTQNALRVFHQGFQTFRSKPRSLVKPFVYQLLSLLLNISVFVLVFFSLGLTNLHLDFFIIVYFIVGTIQIAAAVFSVGALDIALANLFLAYGVPDIGVAAIATTLLRFLTFWMPVVVGYVTVQAIGARRLLNPKATEAITAQQKIKGEPSNVNPPLD